MQITAAETEVASLGEQLKQLGISRDEMRAEVLTLEAAWRATETAVKAAEEATKVVAEEAYKEAAALPPGAFGSDLHGLGSLSRLETAGPPSASSAAAAAEFLRAQEAERVANAAYTEAKARQQAATGRYTALQATFTQRTTSLLQLKQRNESQLVEIERQREANEQQLGSQFVGTGSVDGLQAHEKARAAVRFALAQLGEEYLWGAEGPNRWDCSGLMWGAYRSVGVTLPRVSRDQYQGTKHRSVSRTALLPGDLLFFSSSPTDAGKIHHVGMYVGGGRMVHSPTSNDVVKVSTVWWSRFFAATRVFGAIPGPAAPPPGPPPGTPPTGGGSPTQGAPPTAGNPSPSQPPSVGPVPTRSPIPLPTATRTPRPGTNPTKSPLPLPTSDTPTPSASPTPTSGASVASVPPTGGAASGSPAAAD
ncbi:MAG TPA: NlpC/P60 family protein [Pilimelia sp.]|nr:NlpC/P60 family protein [Pilimelia sp.]